MASRPLFYFDRKRFLGGTRLIMWGFTGPIDYSILRPGDIAIEIRRYPWELSMDGLPDHITNVTAIDCVHNIDLLGLSDNVQEVTLMDCGVRSLAGLPDTLDTLIIHDCPELAWEPALLPSRLRMLGVLGLDGITEFGSLPRRIRIFHFRNLNRLTSIDGIPEAVKTLVTRNMPNLESLSPIPDEIERIVFDRCPKVEAIPFRRNLNHLEISKGYPVLTPDGRDVIEDRLVSNLEEYQDLIHEYEEFMMSRKKSAAY